MKKDKTSEFGKTLKYVMRQSGMSQYQLAHRSGLSESTISKYINGESYPNYTSILSLARALEVPPNVLFMELQ